MDDMIQFDHAFQRAVYHSRDKGTLFFIQILIFVQNLFQRDMTVFPVPVDQKQGVQDQFPAVFPLSHSNSPSLSAYG